MISNERPSPYDRQSRSFRPRYDAQTPKPNANEDLLKSETIQIERKSYVLLLKENARGRFVRVIEDGGGRKNSIIIPDTGIEALSQALNQMLKASGEIPEKDASQ